MGLIYLRGDSIEGYTIETEDETWPGPGTGTPLSRTEVFDILGSYDFRDGPVDWNGTDYDVTDIIGYFDPDRKD
jgi:hypothetical protein